MIKFTYAVELRIDGQSTPPLPAGFFISRPEKSPMRDDNRSLAAAFLDLRQKMQEHPNCFYLSEEREIDAALLNLRPIATRLGRGERLNDAQTHALDRIRSACRRLERKWDTYLWQRAREAERQRWAQGRGRRSQIQPLPAPRPGRIGGGREVEGSGRRSVRRQSHPPGSA